MDYDFLLDTLKQLIEALPTTLELFFAAILLGLCLSLIVTWMRVSKNRLLSNFAKFYIFIFRGSPLMIQMFLVFYGLGQFEMVRDSVFWIALREPFFCAVFSLALCTAGYTAEIFRGALMSVPIQQVEAGNAVGMSGFLLFRRVIFPIAIRQALPAYSTEIILMVKSTALASLVTVWEVTGVAQRIISHSYRTIEVFMCAMVIYLFLNFAIVRVISLIEYFLSPHLRDRSSIKA